MRRSTSPVFWRKFTPMMRPLSTWKRVSLWSLRKSRKLPSRPFRALYPEIKAYDLDDRYCEREFAELRGILTARLLKLIGPYLHAAPPLRDCGASSDEARCLPKGVG